jgi:hypothetical protein
VLHQDTWYAIATLAHCLMILTQCHIACNRPNVAISTDSEYSHHAVSGHTRCTRAQSVHPPVPLGADRSMGVAGAYHLINPKGSSLPSNWRCAQCAPSRHSHSPHPMRISWQQCRPPPHATCCKRTRSLLRSLTSSSQSTRRSSSSLSQISSAYLPVRRGARDGCASPHQAGREPECPRGNELTLEAV